jgi:hydroxymethylpyrimidine/phosphomethylpyrimidine kinase
VGAPAHLGALPGVNRQARDPRTPPRLLTIAGSDSGGGAGLQADLKAFAAHGAYGMSAVTAVTVQNTRGVTAVHPVPPEIVAAQIDAVLDDIGADAIKIGMLGEAAVVRAVAGRLRVHLSGKVPVVLDPVMVAKGGAPLLADEAVAALVQELLPLATVVTPNLPELARLTGLPVASLLAGEEERRRAAEALAQCLPGGPAVLVKGGHASDEGPEVVDLLLAAGEWHRFVHPRLAVRSTHGTGCTLAAALAARLAAGEALPAAAAGAIEYVAGAIAAAYPLGGGIGPVDPLYRCKR